MLWWRDRPDDARAALREVAAVARQGWLLPQPGRSLRGPVDAPHLTVFLHGYMATGGVFGPLAEELARSGVAPRQLHLTYPPAGSIAALATRLAREVSASGAAAGSPVHVVAHSLGGLVARYYAQILGGRLDRLVCLATPHRGTTLARPWPRVPLAREIIPGSATLARLAATRDVLAPVRVCSLVAERDAVVVPVDSAALDGHEVVRLPGVGHQGVLFDPDAWRHVARVLAEPRATTAPPAAGAAVRDRAG